MSINACANLGDHEHQIFALITRAGKNKAHSLSKTTKADLARDLGLDPVTVKVSVDLLIADGLISNSAGPDGENFILEKRCFCPGMSTRHGTCLGESVWSPTRHRPPVLGLRPGTGSGEAEAESLQALASVKVSTLEKERRVVRRPPPVIELPDDVDDWNARHLAIYFGRETYVPGEPKTTNFRAIAAFMAEWRADGVSNEMIVAMIDAFAADPRLRKSGTPSWLSFLGLRARLFEDAKRHTADEEAKAHVNDKSYWLGSQWVDEREAD